MISPVTLLTTLSLGTKCSVSVMISSMDYTHIECDDALTSPDQINVEIIWELSVFFLHSFNKSSKYMWPKSMSQIFEYSSWSYDFVGMPWILNTTSFGVIFLQREDDEDVIKSAKKHIH